jgi:hypothetical protein
MMGGKCKKVRKPVEALYPSRIYMFVVVRCGRGSTETTFRRDIRSDVHWAIFGDGGALKTVFFYVYRFFMQ